MNKIGTSGSSSKGQAPEDIDFVGNDNQAIVGVDLRSRQGRKQSAIVAAVVTTVAAAWFIWNSLVSPAMDERLVRDAIAELRATLPKQRIPGFNREVGGNSEQSNLTVASQLLEDDKHLDASHRKMIEAALRLAARAGSAEAHLVRGVALRDGNLGPKDAEAALSEFQQAWAVAESGVKAGDADALWVRATQVHDGAGFPVDLEAAHQTALRAATQLRGWRLILAAKAAAWGSDPFKSKEPELAERLYGRLLDEGDPSIYRSAVVNCAQLFPDMDGFKPRDPKTVQALKHYEECRGRWYRLAAEAGNVSAMGEYGQWLIQQKGQLDVGLTWLNAGRAELDSTAKMAEAVVLLARSSLAEQTKAALDALSAALAEERQSSSTKSDLVHDWVWDYEKLWVSFKQPDYLTLQEWRKVGAGIALLATSAGHFDVVNDRLRTDAQISPQWQAAYSGFRSADTRQATEEPLMPVRPGPWGNNDEVVVARQAIAPRIAKIPDRDQQDLTGYLRGSERNATGGMSRFTVDNARGGADAVARLYLGGNKPAVRSFFIKKGESFTADGMLAGGYVLRYRFAGTDDTFEADRIFALQQRETETGTAFSSVKVTLLKVASGNMQTKLVPKDAF